MSGLVPEEVAKRCGICEGPQPTRTLCDGASTVQLCITCGVAVGVSPAPVDLPVGPLDAPEGTERIAPPLEQVWIAAPDPASGRWVRGQVQGQGLARRVRVFTRAEELVSACVAGMKSQVRPSLVVLEAGAGALHPADAALGLRAVESVYNARPIPLVIYVDEPADDMFKALLERMGNAKYVRRRAETLSARAERVASLIARLVRRA